MNRILMLLKSNRHILIDVMPSLKFNDYADGYCLTVVTPNQFNDLYKQLSNKGYNPYMLMSWSASETEVIE